VTATCGVDLTTLVWLIIEVLLTPRASVQVRTNRAGYLPDATARPRVLSLFCGGGGLDLGFKRAGFDIALAIDAEASAVATINGNSGTEVAMVADLRKLSAREIVTELRKRGPSVLPRGIIGGPPCQGFSQGNALRDPRDPRNRLPFTYAELVAALDAEIGIDFFVFENVVALTQKKRLFCRLKLAFRKAGFRIFVGQIDAQTFGVPQVRRRLFLVGLNEERFPTHHFIFPKGRSRPRTVREAIHGMPPAVYCAAVKRNAAVPFHPNHWTMEPKSARFRERRFNRWRSFRRLQWDVPSPTVAYGNREIHIHPDGLRRLTVLEAMLLQGFPKGYVLHGNFSEQVTQVSNAVPPPVAFALARTLRTTIEPKVP
jgi:DNA (cytosine-5)-methyltransferase 1